MERDYELYLRDEARAPAGDSGNSTSALLQGLLPAVAPNGLTPSAERTAAAEVSEPLAAYRRRWTEYSNAS